MNRRVAKRLRKLAVETATTNVNTPVRGASQRRFPIGSRQWTYKRLKRMWHNKGLK